MAATGASPEALGPPGGAEQLTARQQRSPIAAFWHRWWLSYAMVGPFFLFYFVFLLFPVVVALVLSFTYYNILQPPHWIGWSNYRLLFLEDDVFLIGIGNTIRFALVTGPASFIVSFIFAWLIAPLKARTVLALCFYAPSITSGVAMSVVWRIVFSGDRYGYLNHLLLSLGILEEPFLWLSDVRSMLAIIIFVQLWMGVGTGFLVFLAGLLGVDPTLYEAGRVDGIANPLQEVFNITLPMMKPQLLFGAILAIVQGFAVFDIAVSLAGLPSPLYAAHTIVTHLYDFAFIRFEMGYAAAVSVVLFAWMFGLSRALFRLFSTKDMY